MELRVFDYIVLCGGTYRRSMRNARTVRHIVFIVMSRWDSPKKTVSSSPRQIDPRVVRQACFGVDQRFPLGRVIDERIAAVSTVTCGWSSVSAPPAVATCIVRWSSWLRGGGRSVYTCVVRRGTLIETLRSARTRLTECW